MYDKPLHNPYQKPIDTYKDSFFEGAVVLFIRFQRIRPVLAARSSLQGSLFRTSVQCYHRLPPAGIEKLGGSLAPAASRSIGA